MNLWLRLLLVNLFGRRRGQGDVLGPCRTPFRVLPTDLDVLGHVNNGKYFSIMDVARVDLMARAGLLSGLRANGWYPVATGETVQFFHSLGPFERFAVVTTVLGWDERSVLIGHTFVRGPEDECVAQAVVRTMFLRRTGGQVRPRDVLALANRKEASPALPEWVVAWSAAQDADRRSLKRAAAR